MADEETVTEDTGEETETTEELETLTIDGQDMQVTKDEMKTLAQKGKAADQRFREAAEERRKLDEERATMTRESQMIKDIQAAQGGDMEAFRRLPGYPELNVSSDDVERIIEGRQGEAEDTDTTEGGTADPRTAQEVSELKKQVGQLQSQLEEENNQKTLNRIRTEVKRTLDGDQVLGYLSKEKPKALSRLADYTVGVLRRYVVEQGRPYNAETLKAAVHEARQYAEEMGISGPTDDTVPATGLGRSPAGLTASIIGRSAKAPARIPSDKALNTADYSRNVFERLAHDALKGRG
jgi:hypothetical protein